MSDINLDSLREKISEVHQGDNEQLDVIFSASSKLLVEAPAGYGKTKTMISKIAFMIASQQVPNPKRLLALTFSVNAAYKIKREVNKQIPYLLDNLRYKNIVSEKIVVSNYHGFCRNVLRKYGNNLHESLRSIDTIRTIDDSKADEITQLIKGLPTTDLNLLVNFSTEVKNANDSFLLSNIDQYNAIVTDFLLPNNVIPYNAILTMTYKLFKIFPKLLEFYKKYFVSILVDEFQDTNLLSCFIVDQLITQKTKVVIFGDSLQRIYGFIGAIPNLLSYSETKFKLERKELKTNYRFAHNPQMLLLDLNIRKIAENPKNPSINEKVIVDCEISPNQVVEAKKIVDKTISLTKDNLESKVAILVKQRGPNIDQIIQSFEANSVSYFYGLFTDEDICYIDFHKKCFFEFINIINSSNRITKKFSLLHISAIKDYYSSTQDPLINAMLDLLIIFWNKLFVDFPFLSNDEKVILIRETFEHYSLKQYIEYVKTNVIISTVHAAKGLEWDYVILPDIEQDLFPNWWGLCQNCNNKTECRLIITDQNEKYFLEELSVFYVAITRARKQVFFSASNYQVGNNNRQWKKNISCFLKLPGFELLEQLD